MTLVTLDPRSSYHSKQKELTRRRVSHSRFVTLVTLVTLGPYLAVMPITSRLVEAYHRPRRGAGAPLGVAGQLRKGGHYAPGVKSTR